MLFLGPVARGLSPFMEVKEQRGFWLTGRWMNYPRWFVELSFEEYRTVHPYQLLFGSPITYLGIHEHKKTVFEFQLGYLVFTDDDALEAAGVMARAFGRLKPGDIMPVVDPMPMNVLMAKKDV